MLAAYQELQAGGHVVSQPGTGSVVAEGGRAGDGVPPGALPAVGFDLSPAGEPQGPSTSSGVVHLASGVPDARFLPGALLGRAYRRAITAALENPLTLKDPLGHPRLRAALATMLARTRGIDASAERIFVSLGGQHALFVLTQALLRPGDVVAVEALGARGAWEAVVRAGGRCAPVPVDAGGLDVEALAVLAERQPLRAVLVTPQRQYPTLAVLTAERRERLLRLAAERRFAVLEVDQDSELHYEGRPVAPLAALDRAGVVVHVGTMDKLLSPGVRLGFVHGPAPLVEALKQVGLALDLQGDLVRERALAELMEDGELQAHLARTLPHYRRRRDVLAAALERHLGSAVKVRRPGGGLALWLEVCPEVDVDAWGARALRLGVSFRPGRQFSFEGAAVPGLRIGFASAAEGELEAVARRLSEALGTGR